MRKKLVGPYEQISVANAVYLLCPFATEIFAALKRSNWVGVAYAQQWDLYLVVQAPIDRGLPKPDWDAIFSAWEV